jgi:hypothetical protein
MLNKTIITTFAKIVQILLANKEIKVANMPKIIKIIKLENSIDTTKPDTSLEDTSFSKNVSGAITKDIKVKKNEKAKNKKNLIIVILLRLMGLDNKINSVPSS